MGHIRPEPARPGVPEQGVEVGTVHVDLPAGVVHLGADLGDAGLVDPVGGRIGDHDRRHPAGVVGQLVVQVHQVDVALVVAGDHYHPQAGEHRAGRVGAVRAGGDQAHVPLGLTAVAV